MDDKLIAWLNRALAIERGDATQALPGWEQTHPGGGPGVAWRNAAIHAFVHWTPAGWAWSVRDAPGGREIGGGVEPVALSAMEAAEKASKGRLP